MAEEVANRSKGAQLEFPHPNRQQKIATHPTSTDNGSLRSPHDRVIAMHHQQHPHRPQQQHPQHHHHYQHGHRNSPTRSQSSLSSAGKISHGLGGLGSVNDQSDSVPIIHPTPMFQRLVSDGVQELKAYARIIENQNRRLSELEAGHRDLEVRVEEQSKRCVDLETTLEHRELVWMEQTRELEKDRDQWKDLVNVERATKERLMEQQLRKDQEIQRMLQRKYDGPITGSIRNANRHATHESPTITNGSENVPIANSPSQTLDVLASHRSPLDWLTAHPSSESLREQKCCRIT